MKVDKARFVELTLLMAAGCGASQSAPNGQYVSLVPPPNAAAPGPSPYGPIYTAPAPIYGPSSPPRSSGTPAPVPVPVPVPVPSPAACADGPVDMVTACAGVSPTCEGLANECRSLTDDLRPKVAAAFAACFAKVKACRSPALGACMRSAILSSCADEGAVAECRDIMDKCKASGKPAKYTLDQCAKILSATTPPVPGDRRKGSFHDVDRERLGPGPSAESCSLTYVLPYQPWGSSWR
ncbi:MAG: hypothetical protein U0183_32305 [Polyangiaceae bacterium]